MPFLRATRQSNSLIEARHGEGLVKRLGNGRVRVRIIEPGQGSSGYYTPEVLQMAAEEGKFDQVPIMRNHPGTGQRTDRKDIDLTVGYILAGTVRYRNGRNPGVYGEAEILEPDRRRIYSLVGTPFGMSIHADGELEREGDVTSKVLRIDKVHSVDLVVSPGAGGAITEVLESKELKVMPNLKFATLLESDQGLVEVFSDENGQLFTYMGEDGLDEAVGDRVRSARDRIGQAASTARQRTSAAAGAVGRGARGAGRHVRGNKLAYGGAAVAAAGGAGAEYLRRRRSEEEVEEEDFDEDNIVEDDQGNRYYYLGNINEDGLEESPESERAAAERLGANFQASRASRGASGVSAAERTAGETLGSRFARSQRGSLRQRATNRAKELGSRVSGSRAGQHLSRNRRRYGIGAGIAGGAALGAGAMRAMGSRKEEAPIYEDDNGHPFVYLEDMYEDQGVEDNTAILESIDAKLGQLLNGDTSEAILEAARDNLRGSSNSRRLSEQAVSHLAQNPREAAVMAGMIGKAIEADRQDRQEAWFMQSNQPLPELPVQAPMGHYGSGGGNLQEQQPAQSVDALLKAIGTADYAFWR